MKSLQRLLAAALLATGLIQHASAQPMAQAVPAASPGLQLDILSDTGGVNLSPYLKSMVFEIKKNWLAQPAQTNQPSARQQETVLTLTIAPNGELSAMKLETPAHDSALDHAAWNATKVTSFAPPPAGMTEPNLKLRVHFTVN